MNHKKYSAVLLAAATGISVLCGCSAPSSGSVSSTANSAASASGDNEFTPALDTSTTQTITVIGSYDNFEALDAAALSFQEYYPNVTVVYEKLDDYNNNLYTRVSADTNVSLFMINRYNFIENSPLADVIADISTLDINFDAIDPDAYETCYIDGKMFGIPLWFRYYGLVVNVDLLEKEGIDLPGNRQEFADACAKLKEAGYVPVQQAANMLGNLYLGHYMHTIAKNCSTEEIKKLMAGEEGSAAVVQEVYQGSFDLLENGYASLDNASTYEDYYNDAILKFYEGDVPFLVASTQTVSGMAKRESKSEAFKNNPFTYRFIYAPTGETGYEVYKADDVGFALNKNCSYYDMAVEFYRFIYTDTILNQFSDVKGAPTVAKNSTNDLYASLPELSAEDVVAFGDIDDPTSILRDVYNDVCKEIFSGNINSTDEAVQTHEKLAYDLAQE